MRNYIRRLFENYNIWKIKRNIFKDTDPKVVAYRQHLFPNGEPSTDEFVKTLAIVVKHKT